MKFCGQYQVCIGVAVDQEATIPCCLQGAGGKSCLGAVARPLLPLWHVQRAVIPLKPSSEKPCGLWQVAKNIKQK